MVKLVSAPEAQPADPLAGLAASIDADTSTQPPPNPEEAAQLAHAEQQFEVMIAKLGVFVGKALRAVRAGVARKLPEIHDEWTDANLQDFANAVPPVAMKYLGRLGPLIGNFPEECALLLAAAPLVAGYVGAVSSHAEATGRIISAPAPAMTPAPGPLHADPMVATPAGPTPVYRVG